MSGKLYSVKHTGPCLVVGYGPSMREDVVNALALRPGVPMLGVKYAACLYPEITHVWTSHLEEAADIKQRAARRIYVHARPKKVQRNWSMHIYGKHDKDIDYVWPDLAWVAASSGIAAALWARHGMGYDEVILCGIPLEHGGYDAQIAAFKSLLAITSFAPAEAMDHWRASVLSFKAKGRMQGITSMSGWTRLELGAPA